MATLKGAVDRNLDILLQLSEVFSQRQDQAMFQLAVNFENCRKKWKYAEEQFVTCQSQLVKAELELTALRVRFKHACNQLDVELRRRHKAELTCEQLERRLQLVHDVLKSDAPGSALHNEDRQNLLQVLAARTQPEQQARTRLQAVDETVTSNISCSSISYDRTRDEMLDLNISAVKPVTAKIRNKRRSSRVLVDRPPVAPRRSRSRSFDQLVDCAGSAPVGVGAGSAPVGVGAGSAPVGVGAGSAPVGVEQIPEDHTVGSGHQLVTAPGAAAPSPDPFSTPASAPKSRPHTFISKTIIMPETCVPCGKRIRFGRVALKCRSCSIVAHPSCKERCPTICSPNFTTISVKNGEGAVGDFAPQTVPMIPSLVVHCVNEIEQRGLQEPGIYRVPGGERLVRELKESYVRGKGLPLLSRVSNIHVVCGLLKDFLRKLKEPLVTFKLHPTFMALSDLPDEQSSRELCRAVSSLPPANRDTLAFLMVHLQRVMESPGCKMDKQNLARVFGPTIVGHSNPNPNPLEVFEDTKRQPKVVEQLLSLPCDYWSRIVPVAPSNSEPAPTVTGHLFKSLTSPEAAEIMNRSPGCWMAPGILAISGKIFPSPTLS
ncbi:rac GTPase-activating protein 1-like [Hemiscyllium ocellatum]|uniref:rac GTPase-activating protein 1-like n=1 Tax=Hemiscyllium ocellatum TaxID=170820 RepID=UPI002965D91C|nr:rac GTPase-activating protein 1-like [Hemiscyllium ocellatum]